MAINSNDKAFLGKGWSFPPTFTSTTGKVEMVTAEQDIKQSLEILFNTKLGERIMQSEYGSDISTLTFETGNVTFDSFVKEQIRNAIILYEPRIVVNGLKFDNSRRQEGIIDIEVDYTIPQINTRNNIVFPFYLEEGTNI